jgi:hypothetical protein
MLEVFADALRLALHAAQVPCSSLDQLELGASGGRLGNGLLDVGVGHLIWVGLGAVAGQVEHLDRIGVLGQPGFHGLGVMHPQVVLRPPSGARTRLPLSSKVKGHTPAWLDRCLDFRQPGVHRAPRPPVALANKLT